MKADPNEGRTELPADFEWRFEEQIKALGIEHQKLLYAASSVFLGASPLSVKAAKKLALLGFGSVAILGDTHSQACFEVPTKQNLAQSALQNLREWAKRETPWAKLETFKELNIERSFHDVEKGFACLVVASAAGLSQFKEEIVHSKKDLFFAFSGATKALLGIVPKEMLSPTLLSSLQKQADNVCNTAGVHLTLLDWTALRLSILLQDYFVLKKQLQLFCDLTETTVSPWQTQTLSL